MINVSPVDRCYLFVADLTLAAAFEGAKPKNPQGGALILTSESPKFFSNGLDYENAIKNAHFHPDVFSPAVIRLLTFPLVTIAAINGHAFAGGFMMTMACDYRVMTSGKAWCCMNEIEFGAPLPPTFAALLRYRAVHARPMPSSDPNAPQPLRNVLRSIALAHRFTPQDMLVNGLVDELAEPSQVRERAVALGKQIGPRATTGVWGSMKQELFREVLDAAERRDRLYMPGEANEKFYKELQGTSVAQGRDSKL